jgi:hypothetical protein
MKFSRHERFGNRHPPRKNENGNTATSTTAIRDHAHTKMYAEGIVAGYTGAATKNCAPV